MTANTVAGTGSGHDPRASEDSIPRCDGSTEESQPTAPGEETSAPEVSTGNPDKDATGSALPLVLKVAGSVVAPTTVLTALLFYFGMLHAFAFFDYFRVDYTVMGLTSQDYLIRSADGLFVPLTVVAGAGLVALWGYRFGRNQLSGHILLKLRGALTPLAAVLGLTLVSMALAAVIDPEAFRSYLTVPGLSLVAGVLLLTLASQPQQSRPIAPRTAPVNRPASGLIAVFEWTAVAVLVSAGLFWSVGDYAGAVGAGRGHDVEAALSSWPDAVVYSAHSLRLQAPGVREMECSSKDPAYHFRYDGLKLVLQLGNQYFFLPGSWTKTAPDGTAIVLPRSDALRLEFIPASMTSSTWPSTC
jgi:hypothetical protein